MPLGGDSTCIHPNDMRPMPNHEITNSVFNWILNRHQRQPAFTRTICQYNDSTMNDHQQNETDQRQHFNSLLSANFTASIATTYKGHCAEGKG